MKSWQKYTAEFLGTFILVFVGSLGILSYNAGGGNPGTSIGFGFGIALLAGMYAFGEVSGGHFNPIVSLAMFLDRRLSALDTVWYWISQFAGAIVASLMILILFAHRSAVKQTLTVSGKHDARAFFLELIASAIFVAVILQVTRSNRYGASALIAIPLTLFVIHVALVPFTGASVNPARTFGPDLISAAGWSDIWVYLLAPPAGAILGWAAYKVTVTGDTSLRDDLTGAYGDMRGVGMDDIRQGPGQVPPPPPPSAPDNPSGPAQV